MRDTIDPASHPRPSMDQGAQRRLSVGSNEFELLEFSLLEVRPDGSVYEGLYGINIFKVRQVIPLPRITATPVQSDLVEGLFDYRGSYTTLVDLRKALSLAQPPPDTDRLVVISEFNKIQVGLGVDSANAIHRVSWDAILAPPDSQKDTIYWGIVGLLDLGPTFVRILNVEDIVARAGLGAAADVEKDVENAIGQLTPAEIPSGVPIAEAGGRQPDPVARAFVGMVMIVDDSGVLRGMVAKLLKSVGVDFVKCRDGQEAWERLQQMGAEARSQGLRIEQIVPLTVVDIEMPRMDGFTLTRNIKSDPHLNGIRVILHSSLGGPENVRKGQEMGADEFATKFDAKILLGLIRKYLPLDKVPAS